MTKHSTKTTKSPRSSKTDDFTPIAILTADLHLQPCAWVDRRRVHGDAYWALQQIFDLAEKYSVWHIIAAGDLLDAKRYDTSVPSDIQELFAQVEERNLRFYYVQGDHDGLDRPWLQLLLPDEEYVTHLSALDSLKINGVTFQGLDYQSPDKLQDALKRVRRDTEVLVMHQTLEELTGGDFIGEMSAAQIPHAKLLLIGDIHKASTQALTGATGQELLVVSPGSPCKQAIDEADKKSCYLLGRAGDGSLAVKQLPLKSRATLRYKIDVPGDVEAILETLTEDIDEATAALRDTGAPPEIADYPLIAVEINTSQTFDWARLRKAVDSRGELFQLRREQQPEATASSAEQTLNAKARLEVVQKGVAAAIQLQVPDEIDRDLLLRLWNAESPAKELKTILAEAGL